MSKLQDKFFQRVILSCEILSKLDYIKEYPFSPDRNYKLDFAYPEASVGIEIQGGLYNNRVGGHSSSAGIIRDMEKSNLAQSLGWVVFHYSASMFDNLEKIIKIQNCISSLVLTRLSK